MWIQQDAHEVPGHMVGSGELSVYCGKVAAVAIWQPPTDCILQLLQCLLVIFCWLKSLLFAEKCSSMLLIRWKPSWLWHLCWSCLTSANHSRYTMRRPWWGKVQNYCRSNALWCSLARSSPLQRLGTILRLGSLWQSLRLVWNGTSTCMGISAQFTLIMNP